LYGCIIPNQPQYHAFGKSRSLTSPWLKPGALRLFYGKLPLPQPPERYLTVGRAMHAIMSLPVDEESVSRVAHLPMIHRDPFDRLLIAQAIQHNLVLATVDTMVRAYPMVMIF
jgi:PIN domain nuclease of toxin-antitoxin system